VRSQLPTPQVGIFDSPEVNAFATGPTKKRSLIAISTGALRQLSKSELEAVLGHEMTHIANGDMVTMTLLQGVVNAFVMFFARILAYVISMRGRNNRQRSPNGAYFLLVWIFEIVFMLLGSMVIAAFSRWREYRADAGGARLSGRQNMIEALQHLDAIQTKKLKGAQTSLAPFMIHSRQEPTLIMKLFSTHPPIQDRISRLQHP
jgi:heat shock protein HtpX